MEWSKLGVAVGDIGQAPKVEDLAQSEGTDHDVELTGEADTTFWGAPLALAMRQVAPASIEPESHLMLLPTKRTSCHEVRTTTSIVV